MATSASERQQRPTDRKRASRLSTRRRQPGDDDVAPARCRPGRRDRPRARSRHRPQPSQRRRHGGGAVARRLRRRRLRRSRPRRQRAASARWAPTRCVDVAAAVALASPFSPTVVAVGSSMGGIAVLRYASTRPGRRRRERQRTGDVAHPQRPLVGGRGADAHRGRAPRAAPAQRRAGLADMGRRLPSRPKSPAASRARRRSSTAPATASSPRRGAAAVRSTRRSAPARCRRGHGPRFRPAR